MGLLSRHRFRKAVGALIVTAAPVLFSNTVMAKGNGELQTALARVRQGIEQVKRDGATEADGQALGNAMLDFLKVAAPQLEAAFKEGKADRAAKLFQAVVNAEEYLIRLGWRYKAATELAQIEAAVKGFSFPNAMADNLARRLQKQGEGVYTVKGTQFAGRIVIRTRGTTRKVFAQWYGLPKDRMEWEEATERLPSQVKDAFGYYLYAVVGLDVTRLPERLGPE